MTRFISFARRHNRDSTVDSICTRCYQTIASEDSEANLETAEKGHTCDPNCEYNWVHPEGENAAVQGILSAEGTASVPGTYGLLAQSADALPRDSLPPKLDILV